MSGQVDVIGATAGIGYYHPESIECWEEDYAVFNETTFETTSSPFSE